MATITAAMVKDLRETTGVGMMDCKQALAENNGDMQAAIDWLRKKGLSKASKKAGRVAAEGLIGAITSGTKGVVIEVNSETDFVARNEQFQGLVKMVAQVALSVGADVEVIKATTVGSATVETAITDAIATIGENMTLRRAKVLTVPHGVVATYVHNSLKPGLGKIGVLVAVAVMASVLGGAVVDRRRVASAVDLGALSGAAAAQHGQDGCAVAATTSRSVTRASTRRPTNAGCSE